MFLGTHEETTRVQEFAGAHFPTPFRDTLVHLQAPSHLGVLAEVSPTLSGVLASVWPVAKYGYRVEDSSLWTRPFFDRPKLGELMLNRAKSLPLIVAADCSSVEARYELLKFAFRKYSRFLELDLEATGDQAHELVLQIDGTMPFLTKLKLHTIDPVYLRNTQLYGIPFACLRELYLKRCIFSPKYPYMCDLNHLEIHMRPSDPTQVSFRRLLVILGRNPGLESLRLHHVTYSSLYEGSLPIPVDAKLRLQQLKALELHQGPGLMNTILCALDMPKLRCLQLSNGREEEQDLAPFVTLFGTVKAWRETMEDELQYLMFRVDDNASMRS